MADTATTDASPTIIDTTLTLYESMVQVVRNEQPADIAADAELFAAVTELAEATADRLLLAAQLRMTTGTNEEATP